MESDAPNLAPLRPYRVRTSAGPMLFGAAGPRPAVLMIHGFQRSPANLLDWRRRIPDLGFVHLPGHAGAEELGPPLVETWIQGLADLLSIFETLPLLIAESLGAVLALSVPSRAVIAVEPLRSVDRLWPMLSTLRNSLAKGQDFRADYEALFSRRFEALERIGAPTLVLAGDVPLEPPRDLQEPPSLLSDADFAAYAVHPLVEARRIPGGHTLLDENPEGVMAASAAFMARHGYL